MPLNDRDTLPIIKWWKVSRKRSPVSLRVPYSANSLIVLTNLISKPGLFYQVTRFEIDIWIEYSLNPLVVKMKYPRSYESWNHFSLPSNQKKNVYWLDYARGVVYIFQITWFKHN